MELFLDQTIQFGEAFLAHLTSAQFYAQAAIIGVGLVLSWAATQQISRRVPVFRNEPLPGVMYEARTWLHGLRPLILPVTAAIMLGIATPVSEELIGSEWLVRAAQGLAIIFLVYSLANHFISSPTIIYLLRWIGVPVAILYMTDLLDDLVRYLESMSVEIGNIDVSLYAIIRTAVFGAVLFWLGRVSTLTGKRVIRTRQALDAATREVIAKLFEITVFVVIFLLLINVMGIDLTALAVFSGAVGVGLGFGLQQIASNFISGLIILLDRSLTIGDFIALEDGRAGTLRELTMRSATLETFDGKDIMVPNERFITTAFTNWTHFNKKQRYPLRFQVAYSTDVEMLIPLVRDVVASHPQVLSGEHLPISERPSAEIESFADSGIDILVEFWMEGIDDGENCVCADLLLMIWSTLKTHGIEIPFPQREVRILSADAEALGQKR